MKLAKITLSTLALTLATLGANANAAGAPDWDAIEAGRFSVDFSACTADGHVAQVHFAMTTYSPMDEVPAGYTQSTPAETAAAATPVFTANYSPFVAKATDADTQGVNFLAAVGSENSKIQDENGQWVTTSVVNVAMNQMKMELMKSLKYSGLGIDYENSSVKVDAGSSCSAQ